MVYLTLLLLYGYFLPVSYVACYFCYDGFLCCLLFLLRRFPVLLVIFVTTISCVACFLFVWLIKVLRFVAFSVESPFLPFDWLFVLFFYLIRASLSNQFTALFLYLLYPIKPLHFVFISSLSNQFTALCFYIFSFNGACVSRIIPYVF